MSSQICLKGHLGLLLSHEIMSKKREVQGKTKHNAVCAFCGKYRVDKDIQMLQMSSNTLNLFYRI